MYVQVITRGWLRVRAWSQDVCVCVCVCEFPSIAPPSPLPLQSVSSTLVTLAPGPAGEIQRNRAS
jgi:hypothetical protein